MIPFLVMDRPNALQLALRASANRAASFGIMTHARVSERFADDLARLRKSRDANHHRSFYLIADSGAFARDGVPLDEMDLFDRYERMGVDYGVVNDVLRDCSRTLENSARAIRAYTRKHRSFHLVGVAQGRSPDEYLECYRELLQFGFQHIAVGGLLQKKPRSVRFTQVESARRMQRVIMGIKQEFRPNWLYILGAYHPRRHTLFDGWRVWGSDYKGWLLRYPSIFDGFKALSQVMRSQKMPARPLQAIREVEHCLRIFRESPVGRRKQLRQILLSHHAGLWRSRAIANLLTTPDLPRSDRRTIRAVFWQSPATRRRSGILHHLRDEVFPLLDANSRPLSWPRHGRPLNEREYTR